MNTSSEGGKLLMRESTHTIKFGRQRTSKDWSRSDTLTDFFRGSVEAARVVEAPFYHLEFDRVFPEDTYQQMLAAMPVPADYRPMSGRGKSRDTKPTRVKIDLFPEFIRHPRTMQREVWSAAGHALSSRPVKQAFMQRFAAGLSRRFDSDYLREAMYPIPILTRDITGYSIPPHRETRWKGIGTPPKRTQMRFAPNTGYAFAVSDNTWHSADRVGPEVKSRDSILLTYFLRNKARYVGALAS